MNSKEISRGILRSISILVGVVLLFYFLYVIRSVIVFIFIAFAVSLIGRPLADFLTSRLRFPNTVSAVITLILLLTSFFGIIAMVVPLLLRQAENLSLLDTQQLANMLYEQLNEIDKYLESKNLDIIRPEDTQKSLSMELGLNEFTTSLSSMLNFIGNSIFAIFSIFFIAFYFLSEKDLFNRMIISAVPTKDEAKTLQVISTIKSLLSRYFIGLVFQVFIMFSLYFTNLLIFDIEDAFIIAFFCGLLNLIPYLGPLIGFFVINILSMSSMFGRGFEFQNEILPTLLYISIGYLIAQLIDNFFNQPIIYAKSVKSHPLEIFIVMLITGLLFGIIGVAIAVPLYTVVRVILKNFFSQFKIVQSITKNI